MPETIKLSDLINIKKGQTTLPYETFHSVMEQVFRRYQKDDDDTTISDGRGISEGSLGTGPDELTPFNEKSGLPTYQTLGLVNQTLFGTPTGRSFSVSGYIGALYEMLGGKRGDYNAFWNTKIALSDLIASISNSKLLSKIIDLKK